MTTRTGTRMIARCAKCQTVITVTVPPGHDRGWVDNVYVFSDTGTPPRTGRAVCHCNANPLVHEIVGTYHEATRCDPRCEGAVGWRCECSCAGVNHGRAFF